MATTNDNYKKYQESDAVKQAKANLDQTAASKPGVHQSQWQTQLDDTMEKILNREKFSYDLNGDALYRQYKDNAMLQGQQAMMDTMGQAAAMTGGYGNSYAQMAGQQAYQQSLQQLNNVVPELYQLALDKYNREGQALYDQYGLLSGQEDRDYGRYRDAVSDWKTDMDHAQSRYDKERSFDYSVFESDRNFDYQQGRDAVADEQWQTSFDYQKDRDDVADSQWQQSFDYQKDRDKKADDQWQAAFDANQTQHDEQMALSREQWEWEQLRAAGGDDTTGILWYQTGTYDDNSNPIFRNSEGETQAFGPGINPYTGSKHRDAQYGTFSNGYQPNNIGGTPLESTDYSTDIYGKEQTIWKANGKYWLWNGRKNRYDEIDPSVFGS